MSPERASRESVCAELEAARSLVPEIRKCAAAAEAARRIPDDLVQAMADRELVQMAVPEAYGGRESHVLDILKVIEEVSYGDGSAGWCLMNYQTTALVSGLLPDEWGRAVFAGAERAVPAGVLGLTAKGRRRDGGMTVSGRWRFASGCPGANWLAGAVVVEGTGGEDRKDEVVLAMFSRDQFEIFDTWQVSGLCGSGSHDVGVSEAFVPDGRWASLGAPPAVQTTLYRIPIVSIFPPCVVAVSLGIARAAIDCFQELAQHKQPTQKNSGLIYRAATHIDFAKAEALVDAGRSYVYETSEALWDEVASGRRASTESRRRARLASCHAAAGAAEAVDLLYAAAGSSSIFSDQPLQRHWRDIHATTQHMQIGQGNYESMGKLRLIDELEGPF